MPIQSSPLFSERRNPNGPIQMNRSEQTVNTPLRQEAPKDGKGGGDSVMKVLIWAVVVVLVAVVIYLLINNLTSQKTPSENPQTGEQQQNQPETLEPITAAKNPTSGAESAPDATDYQTVAQNVGSNSSDTFTIDSFSTESYKDFFRVVFMVTSSGTAKFPLTEATLENQEISLTFNKISEDKSGLSVGVDQEVINSVVKKITHNPSQEEKTENYTIELASETGYFVHLLEQPNRIVVDIKEETATQETGEETQQPEETGEPTTGKPTVKTLTNEFSKNPQWIVSNVTGNVVNTTAYKWQDLGAYIKVTYDISGGIPNVSAQIEKDGTTSLVIVMSNRVSKNASSTININRGNVTTMEAVTSGNTSTLTLHLNKESDYRIYATESPMQFFIEVKD